MRPRPTTRDRPFVDLTGRMNDSQCPRRDPGGLLGHGSWTVCVVRASWPTCLRERYGLLGVDQGEDGGLASGLIELVVGNAQAMTSLRELWVDAGAAPAASCSAAIGGAVGVTAVDAAGAARRPRAPSGSFLAVSGRRLLAAAG